MKTRTPRRASYTNFVAQQGGGMNVHRGVMYPRRRMAGGGIGRLLAGVVRAAARKAPAVIGKAVRSKVGKQLKKVVQEKVAEKAVELVSSGLGGGKPKKKKKEKKKKVCVKRVRGQKGGSGLAKTVKARTVFKKK